MFTAWNIITSIRHSIISHRLANTFIFHLPFNYKSTFSSLFHPRFKKAVIIISSARSRCDCKRQTSQTLQARKQAHFIPLIYLSSPHMHLHLTGPIQSAASPATNQVLQTHFQRADQSWLAESKMTRALKHYTGNPDDIVTNDWNAWKRSLNIYGKLQTLFILVSGLWWIQSNIEL